MSPASRLTATLRVAGINLVVLAVLLGAAEIVARLAYPEFHGHIHSDVRTLTAHYYHASFSGFQVRVPYPGHQVSATRPLFVVLGDSISHGYGMAYEDIYWVRLQRLATAPAVGNLQFLALAGYGNNLADSAHALETLARNARVAIRFVLYQFNLNDISPYGRAELRKLGDEGIVHRDLFRNLARWRYEYLNHSVFARVAQHYAGRAARRLSGNCEERGLDALGPYTWSYGSIKYRDESETYWRRFAKKIAEVKQVTDKLGARFLVFVSPIVFDIDRAGLHPYFNHIRLDFDCATIDPRSRLDQITRKLSIRVVDPAPYLRQRFEARVAENNFTPFFFTADHNHFNQVAATYVAEYLAAAIVDFATSR